MKSSDKAPVMRKIPNDSFIGTHYLDKEEEAAAVEVIRSKSLFRYDGPKPLGKSSEFEERLQAYLKTDNVLACSSGAAALKLCCVSLGIGPKDEVLLSPFTFIASAAAVLSCGAVPNFVEVDESMNIDPKRIEACITPRTKAIMAVHIQGVPCDMVSILQIADKYGLKVIEDAAQAVGARYNGARVGTIGDAAAFSLQANKVITCGEGGIFICGSKAGFEEARRYHDNGGKRENNQYPVWDHPDCSYGENLKITEIQSAIAIEQLKKADLIIERQRKLYNGLIESLDLKRLRLRPVPEKAEPVPVSLCLIFDTQAECREFIIESNDRNIPLELFSDKVLTSYTTFRTKKSWHESGVPYYFVDYRLNSCPLTEDLSQRTGWLSISPLFQDEDLRYIQDVFNSLAKSRR